MDPKKNFWNISTDQLYKELNTQASGLSSEEIPERLKFYGPNTLEAPAKHFFRQFLSRFSNPLILVLLLASIISAYTGDTTGFLLISTIIVMSVTLDFFQEYRAERTVEKLNKTVAVKANILRNGVFRELLIGDIVPGDVVLLAAGDLVPADGVVIEEKDVFVNQSFLTGESYPVEKKLRSIQEASQDILNLDEATNAFFFGSSIVSGSAKMLVCKTGSQTELGQLAKTLSRLSPPTAFDIGIRKFGFLIMRLTIALVLFVIMVNLSFHRPWLESFLFAIALAVGLTPELLPMIVTVTLSRGALRMAKKWVIVKRMSSIQNLGGMDILCSDKTGTLTEGKIVLEKHVDVFGHDNIAVLSLAYLNSYFETGYKSPIDKAIIEHQEIDSSAWQKIDEVPFDFERRRVSVLIDNGQKRYLVVKGASEEILDLCSGYSLNLFAKENDFNDESRKAILNLRTGLETEGFRCIGVAWKEIPRTYHEAHVSDEKNLIFAGLAAFHDPPKKDIKKILKKLSEIHVELKVITGDSEAVTRHLFDLVGLKVTGIMTGNEIQKMDDPTLEARVEEVNLFCRVSPIQKNRIILSLKQRGHTVGYLGDGANDAPPLHSADVGISVDSGTDVAKEAADIVLLKHNLGTLIAGVLEGRRTHLNIMKYIMMGTSSNFGNMFSMAGATLLLPFLPMLPLQILLNNFLYDISEITIPMDRVDLVSLKKPTHWNIQFIHRFMWATGLISSLFDFLTFYLLIRFFHADEKLFHTGWFVESMATQVLVIFIIRTRLSPWQSCPSKALAWTSLSVVATAAILPFTPLAKAFGFVSLNLEFFAILIVLLICYLLMVEIVKRWFYRGMLQLSCRYKIAIR